MFNIVFHKVLVFQLCDYMKPNEPVDKIRDTCKNEKNEESEPPKPKEQYYDGHFKYTSCN